MKNNQLTDLRIEQLLEKVGVFILEKSQDLQDVAAALRELQERRQADKPPVHPTIASEQLDDKTLQELIEFRRSTFEYHSKEGHKVQTIIHGVILSALIELKERRKAAEPIYQLFDMGWYDTDKQTHDNAVSAGCAGRIVYAAPQPLNDTELAAPVMLDNFESAWERMKDDRFDCNEAWARKFWNAAIKSLGNT